MQDLVAGQIDLAIDTPSNYLAQVRAASVKAYAVASRARLATAPDIPNVDEAGLPGFYASLWFGLWAPRGTPRNALAKLHAAVADALADPTVRSRVTDLGACPSIERILLAKDERVGFHLPHEQDIPRLED